MSMRESASSYTSTASVKTSNLTMQKILVFLLLGSFVYVPFVFGAGISTTFSEVLVENLQPGKSYSMKDIANYPFKIANTSEMAVKIKLGVIKPDTNSLRSGFMPIPDTSCIVLEKESIEIEPGSVGVSDIIINIPENADSYGKKYQANIWSRTSNDGMFGLSAGLESILLITTSEDPVQDDGSQANKVNLNFNVKPRNLYVKNVKIGKKQSIKKLSGAVLQIYNPDEKACTFEVESIPVKGVVTTSKEGYLDTPEPSFLKFSETSFVIPPEESREVELYLEFPKKKEFRKKKYIFIIYTTTKSEDVVGGMYSKIFVTTK